MFRAPATSNDEGLADAGAANPFSLPRNYPGSRFVGPAPARDATVFRYQKYRPEDWRLLRSRSGKNE
jgi:hypothetical protein